MTLDRGPGAPPPLTRREWAAIATAGDRTSRAFLWFVVFAGLGLAGTALGFGAGDEWIPLVGVAVVILGAIGYLWATARCPRCGARPLLFRRSLPAACPRCGVSFEEPPREGYAPGTSLDAAGDDQGG